MIVFTTFGAFYERSAAKRLQIEQFDATCVAFGLCRLFENASLSRLDPSPPDIFTFHPHQQCVSLVWNNWCLICSHGLYIHFLNIRFTTDVWSLHGLKIVSSIMAFSQLYFHLISFHPFVLRLIERGGFQQTWPLLGFLKWTREECVWKASPPPLANTAVVTWSCWTLAELRVQTWPDDQNSSVITIPAVQRDFIPRYQPPPSSPQVFSNSSPFDVWKHSLWSATKHWMIVCWWNSQHSECMWQVRLWRSSDDCRWAQILHGDAFTKVSHNSIVGRGWRGPVIFSSGFISYF